MKFGNVVLYCKGWYQRRGDLDKMWMDLIHCIEADGWTMLNKNDVARWCMHRLDEMRDDEVLKNHKNMFTFSHLYSEIQRQKELWHYRHDEPLSEQDAIIGVFVSIVSCLEKSCFTEGVRPSEKVLPLNYHEAYYSDGRFSSDGKPSLTPADMHCDVMARIEEFFPNYPEQDTKSKWFCEDFDSIESRIRGKNFEDVVVRIGSDNLNDCNEYILSGDVIKKHKISYGDVTTYIKPGIYDNCVNIDKDKHYVVRVEKVIDNWGDNEVIIRSIKAA